MAQVTISSNLLNKLRGKNITVIVNQEVADFSSEVLARLKTDYVKDKNGMWVIADKDSKRSIDKWRKYRVEDSSSMSFVFRNDAKNDKGVLYPKYIVGSPFVSREKGLDMQFFDDMNSELKNDLIKSIKTGIKGI